MSEVFMQVGNWFLERGNEIVDYTKYSIEDVDGVPMSTGCFGCWLALYYNTEKFDGKRLFVDGANAFARDLGFDVVKKYSKKREQEEEVTFISLRDWADDNKDIWGNDNGRRMFCSKDAFNEGSGEYGDEEDITTESIGRKLIGVSKRML